jgi:hypothetical protein
MGIAVKQADRQLLALMDALDAAKSPAAPTRAPGDLGRALFVGSGDSLSACLLAEPYGHRAASAGDLAWTGGVPPHVDTVVGVSHSGRTRATVAALETARAANLRTVAVTVDPDSPLASVGDDLVLAPGIALEETIPAAGYLSLALTVRTLLGDRADEGFGTIARCLGQIAVATGPALTALPEEPPTGISVLSLPDLRSAGDFWSLKLIEATGICVRSVPLEESGHVDYFIGPQPHLTILLVGGHGPHRHARLRQALEANGHSMAVIDVARALPVVDPRTRELSAAALGAHAAHLLSLRWKLPPFRNGEVLMDASHIQADRS